MVQALDPVLGVNTFYHHHCHEHVGVGQLGRITGEKGLNLVGFTRGNYEIDLIAGNVRTGYLVHNLSDLGNDNSFTIVRCFAQNWRFFRIGPGVEVALGIGLFCANQRNIGYQIGEIAAVQLGVGVDRADGDAAGLYQLCQRNSLLS